MLTIHYYRTIFDDNLQKDWIYLQTGDDMTAFQQLEWMKLQEVAFKKNRMLSLVGEIYYVEVKENNIPLIILPLHVQRHSIKLCKFGYSKGLYLMGKGYTDYANMIYRNLNKDLLSFIFDDIFHKWPNLSLKLKQIRENTQLSSLLTYLGNKYDISVIGEENCVSLRLPRNLDDYFRSLSRNLISNLKKQRNRYKRDMFSIDYVLHQGICDDYNVVTQIKIINNQRFKKKNAKNFSAKFGRFLGNLYGGVDEVGYALRSNPQSWLLVGKKDGKIITYIFGLKDSSAVRIMQLGFLDEYERYMPGIIMFLSYLKDSYSDLSGTEIDFTRGEERYKYELGGIKHTIYDYCIKNNK